MQSLDSATLTTIKRTVGLCVPYVVMTFIRLRFESECPPDCNLQGVPKMTPMLFCKIFYNQWHFFSRILHTHVFNKDTHVDHFWCL